jgi:hypothetical protein
MNEYYYHYTRLHKREFDLQKQKTLEHRKIIQHPEKDKSSNELQKKSLSVLGKSCFTTKFIYF